MFADLFRAQAGMDAGWFARTPFQRYQASAVRLRAIETRRDVVRAANTGISGFADARARLFDATPLSEEAAIVRDVAVHGGTTIYVRSGDVVAWVAVAGALVTSLMAWMGR